MEDVMRLNGFILRYPNTVPNLHIIKSGVATCHSAFNFIKAKKMTTKGGD